MGQESWPKSSQGTAGQRGQQWSCFGCSQMGQDTGGDRGAGPGAPRWDRTPVGAAAVARPGFIVGTGSGKGRVLLRLWERHPMSLADTVPPQRGLHSNNVHRVSSHCSAKEIDLFVRCVNDKNTKLEFTYFLNKMYTSCST